MATFLEALAQGPLVVDGAMGTQLYERGVLFSNCFEELNLTKPDLVRKVHEDYVRAGATVIETNTFGANAMRLEKHGLVPKMARINEVAVQIAREAAENPELVKTAPHTTRIRRLDETAAARKPILRWQGPPAVGLEADTAAKEW